MALRRGLPSFGEGGAFGDERLFRGSDNDSDATTFELGSYDVPKFGANFYYAGIGPKRRGSKLSYRTSDDVLP